MTIPSVVGIGFPKAATTYIAAVLADHAEICFSSRKETHFFEQNEVREMARDEADARYGAYFKEFDADHHRFAMEWTVTYIGSETVLDRMKTYLDPGTTFLLASRDPVRSVLSSYFYHRTISNDQHAARMTQHQCIDRRPDVYIDPYMMGTSFRRFRERFPDSKILVIPQSAIKRSSEEVFTALFRHLGVSQSDGWQNVERMNVPYPYRSWRADKLIRWILVQIYGNRPTKILYSRPDSEKPAFMKFLHDLNRGTYEFEPGVEDRLTEKLMPDFKDFVETVWSDENAIVLGTRQDLGEGLV